jgi:hypothetical protein
MNKAYLTRGLSNMTISGCQSSDMGHPNIENAIKYFQLNFDGDKPNSPNKNIIPILPPSSKNIY